ncbi:MAG: hypothetical protein NXI28_07300 [bacterium]|nr:hypothetical protein [bacterium]
MSPHPSRFETAGCMNLALRNRSLPSDIHCPEFTQSDHSYDLTFHVGGEETATRRAKISWLENLVCAWHIPDR